MNSLQLLNNEYISDLKVLERRNRGLELYNQGLIEQINDHQFMVKSQYIVDDLSTEQTPIFTCNCKDYEYRTDIEYCKHIHGVLYYILNGA